jgi:aminocarboxymuconate-semialdehyde decarboxylase
MLARMRNLLPKAPSEYARLAYYDALVFDKRTVRYLVDMMGARQVTVGSDFPFVAREDPVGKSVRAVVDDDEWDLISHKNVLRFLGK